MKEHGPVQLYQVQCTVCIKFWSAPWNAHNGVEFRLYHASGTLLICVTALAPALPIWRAPMCQDSCETLSCALEHTFKPPKETLPCESLHHYQLTSFWIPPKANETIRSWIKRMTLIGCNAAIVRNPNHDASLARHVHSLSNKLSPISLYISKCSGDSHCHIDCRSCNGFLLSISSKSAAFILFL